MRELAELAKRDFERLKTTYIMRETNGEVIDLYPNTGKELTAGNLTMIFVPKNSGEAVILEPEDLSWADSMFYDYDFKIDDSSDLKSNICFSRVMVGDELSSLLDIEIGRRILAKEFSKQELKNMYFFAAGKIYPATDENDEPTLTATRIYDISIEEFRLPEMTGENYFLEDVLIEEAPLELWPIIKELAESI